MDGTPEHLFVRAMAIKNAAGKVMGNEQMRAEGEAQHLKGKAERLG